MFNGQKPHHPNVRFFLYFARRSGPGCCCARADKKVGSNLRFSRYAPRNGQLGRPTRSLCSAEPESSGSIGCLLLYELLVQLHVLNTGITRPLLFDSIGVYVATVSLAIFCFLVTRAAAQRQ